MNKSTKIDVSNIRDTWCSKCGIGRKIKSLSRTVRYQTIVLVCGHRQRRAIKSYLVR